MTFTAAWDTINLERIRQAGLHPQKNTNPEFLCFIDHYLVGINRDFTTGQHEAAQTGMRKLASIACSSLECNGYTSRFSYEIRKPVGGDWIPRHEILETVLELHRYLVENANTSRCFGYYVAFIRSELNEAYKAMANEQPGLVSAKIKMILVQAIHSMMRT